MTLIVRSLNAGDYDLLTFNEALALTESIRLSVADLELLIVTAYYGQAWLALDYPSWDEYVKWEFKAAPLAMPREDRKSTVASLRSQGLSLRAIGSVTGVDPVTVKNDLEGVEKSTPERIRGADGKNYQASRPKKNDTPPAPREVCPTCGQKLSASQQQKG